MTGDGGAGRVIFVAGQEWAIGVNRGWQQEGEEQDSRSGGREKKNANSNNLGDRNPSSDPTRSAQLNPYYGSSSMD